MQTLTSKSEVEVGLDFLIFILFSEIAPLTVTLETNQSPRKSKMLKDELIQMKEARTVNDFSLWMHDTPESYWWYKRLIRKK
jgi:hypothetical protein